MCTNDIHMANENSHIILTSDDTRRSFDANLENK